MNKKIPGLIFVLSLSFNAAFLIYLFTAQPGPRGTQGSEMKLNLTEQQKKRMEPIQVKIHRENAAIKTKIAKCQEELLAALKADPVDRTAVNTCIERINNLQKKIQLNTIEEIIRIRKYMNPDQCTCLIEGLGAALDNSPQTCNCPHCRTHKK